jgi:hypothetical protein
MTRVNKQNLHSCQVDSECAVLKTSAAVWQYSEISLQKESGCSQASFLIISQLLAAEFCDKTYIYIISPKH